MNDFLQTQPTLTLVGGPNGAGKSTLVEALREAECNVGRLVNPDIIARSLRESGRVMDPPTGLDVAAGRAALRLTRDLISQQQSFTRETTLTGNAVLRMLQAAKEAGYDLTLIFVGVDSVETAKDRVRRRVEAGGHDIPAEVQERRFQRSFQNAARAAAIADRAFFYHNGDRGHELVAKVTGSVVIEANFRLASWPSKILRGLARADKERP